MTEARNRKLSLRVTWPQWMGAFGSMLLYLQVGIMAGWSSPYVAQLTSPESHLKVTINQISWIVSLMNLGRIVGAVIGAIFVNYFGSKTTILINSTPITMGWLFVIIGDDVTWLYASRLLEGVGLGMASSCFSLYMGEIADPEIRGVLVSLGMTGTSLGNLVICLMGAYLKMEVSSIVNLGFSLIMMTLFFWLPETPHYYVRMKQNKKAKMSLRWYHRNLKDEQLDSELMSLTKFIESYENVKVLEILKELSRPPLRKAMILVLLLFFFAQMCGLNNIMFYMESILRSAGVTVIDPALVVIVVMVFGVIASLTSMLLIDRFGRRFLMCLSSFIVCISLVCLGTTFVLLRMNFDSAKIQYLPIVAMVLFQIATFIGILSIPNAILSELFPPHVKCVAACIGSATGALFSFSSTATYQLLIDTLTEEYTFFFYACILITAIPFTLFFLPETKGKSLQEIQDQLISNISKSDCKCTADK